MTSTDFAVIAAFLKDRSGLIITQDKTYLLETRLAAILRDHDLAGLSGLADHLRQPGPSALKSKVVDAMTTNETSFFRDNHPVDTMRQSVIPGLIERRAGARALRIWSSACSTGQEPYSLAMMIKDNFPILGGWRVEIVVAQDRSQPCFQEIGLVLGDDQARTFLEEGRDDGKIRAGHAAALSNSEAR